MAAISTISPTLTRNEAVEVFRVALDFHQLRDLECTVDEVDDIIWWTAEADVGGDEEAEWVSMSFPEHWPEVDIAWGE